MRRWSTLPRAFTLLELLVVLVLVAVLAAAVVVNLHAPHHAALAEQAIGRWMLVDRQMRHHSDQFRRPSALSFQLNGNSLTRTDFHGKEPIGSVIELPRHVRIDRYVGSARSRARRRGPVEIRYSPHGQTDTYAVRFAGSGFRETWLLFLGVTGEVKRGLTEAEVHEALRLSSRPARP